MNKLIWQTLLAMCVAGFLDAARAQDNQPANPGNQETNNAPPPEQGDNMGPPPVEMGPPPDDAAPPAGDNQNQNTTGDTPSAARPGGHRAGHPVRRGRSARRARHRPRHHVG